MYLVSNAFLRAVQENTRNYCWTGQITTKGGSVYPFAYEDIVKGSGYITAQCCGSAEIELGTVYDAEMGITLFSQIDRYTLEGAEVRLSYHLRLADGSYEEVPMGIFEVSEANRTAHCLELKAYDYMLRFEKSFNGFETVGNAWAFLDLCCKACKVELAHTQAEIEAIYREYLEGANYKEISAGLEADGILTAAGNPRWHASTLKKILTNEKYMGDALLQKTYTVDCLTKKRVANDGTVPQYYVNNDHEAIIPRELFARVQEEMKRRANIRQGMDGRRRVYSSKYALSSIVFCGHCGDMYRRTHWNNHGKKQIVWRCVTRLNAPGVECPARTLSEIQLQNLVLEAINKVLGGKQRAIRVLETNISEVLRNAHSEELERIKQQIEKQ